MVVEEQQHSVGDLVYSEVLGFGVIVKVEKDLPFSYYVDWTSYEQTGGTLFAHDYYEISCVKNVLAEALK